LIKSFCSPSRLPSAKDSAVMRCEKPMPTTIQAGSPPKEPLIPERVLIVGCYIACALIWGTTWFAIRLSVAADGFPPFMSVAMRCTLAALIVAAISLAGKIKTQKPSSDQMLWLVLAGAFSAMGFGLVYTAEKWISGGICSILNATSPLLMALVATVTGAERVSKGSIAGSLLAFGGIYLIFQERVHASPDQALGICLMMGSALLAVINNVILKKHTRQQHPLASTGAFAVAC